MVISTPVRKHHYPQGSNMRVSVAGSQWRLNLTKRTSVETTPKSFRFIPKQTTPRPEPFFSLPLAPNTRTPKRHIENVLNNSRRAGITVRISNRGNILFLSRAAFGPDDAMIAIEEVTHVFKSCNSMLKNKQRRDTERAKAHDTRNRRDRHIEKRTTVPSVFV